MGRRGLFTLVFTLIVLEIKQRLGEILNPVRVGQPTFPNSNSAVDRSEPHGFNALEKWDRQDDLRPQVLSILFL
jgi:hypothetical protein